ncbi:MAG: glycosyltransferase family 4 protein [Firmicutes bacterium]|nr:glycosyltransferase family 4 protein [Bacillota bacterium]
MRIVVNDIAAGSGGALSILKSFYNYLVNTEKRKENEWIFLLSDKYIEETDNIRVLVLNNVKKSWISRLKFDLYKGKSFMSQLNPDVIFSLQNTITFGMKCPQVLYMHQSIPFQKVKKFSFFKSEERILAIYQHFISKIIIESIKKADITIVQTNWIKDAVVNSTNISSQKIKVVFPPQQDYIKFKKNSVFESKSFFYPAGNNKYKNHQCIYDACTILREKGITDYTISLTIEGEKNNKNISYLGKIPFELTMEKYNTSTLLFPSYIETVGLPLIEARQMGTIILAADCPFSREALDGYENAYFFNPFLPKELAYLMYQVLSGEIIRKSENNLEIKTENSWKDIEDIIFNVAGEA